MSQARADRVNRLLELEAVRRQAILDIPHDGSLDTVAELARRIVGCKAAIIDIVDSDGLFRLSHPGQSPDTIEPEPVRFASIASEDCFAFDVREAANAVRAGDLGFGFYAGLPLRTADGHRLGTLALVDSEPRTIAETEMDSLKLLASVVIDMLELRLAARAKVAAAVCELS